MGVHRLIPDEKRGGAKLHILSLAHFLAMDTL